MAVGTLAAGAATSVVATASIRTEGLALTVSIDTGGAVRAQRNETPIQALVSVKLTAGVRGVDSRYAALVCKGRAFRFALRAARSIRAGGAHGTAAADPTAAVTATGFAITVWNALT